MIKGITTLLENDYYRYNIYLYIVIVGGAVWLAFFSQKSITMSKSVYKVSQRQEKIWGQMQVFCFILSFLILWFFSAFADCGADRESYRTIFREVRFSSVLDGWQEPGFVLFNLFFRVFGSNPNIVLIAIPSVTLLLIFSTLYDLRREINIGYAVLGYGSLFYVQSLSLMRMYMAGAILFWGVRYLKKNEYGKYITVILVAALIHYSSLIMFLPLGLICLLYHRRYEFMVHLFIVCIGLCGGFILFIVAAPILSQVTIFARFQRYLDEMAFGGIGIMQFVYNIPICLLVMVCLNEIDTDDRRIVCAFTSAHFFVCIMSYIIPMLGRAIGLFQILYLFVIPLCIRIVNKEYKKKRIDRKIYVLFHVSIIFYYLLRFFIYISEYAFLDGIMPYKNIVL